MDHRGQKVTAANMMGSRRAGGEQGWGTVGKEGAVGHLQQGPQTQGRLTKPTLGTMLGEAPVQYIFFSRPEIHCDETDHNSVKCCNVNFV